VTDHEDIDIVSLEVKEKGTDQLEVILKVAGEINNSRDLYYSIHIGGEGEGNAHIFYSGGEGSITYGDESEDDDITVSDDTLIAVLQGDKVEDSPHHGLWAWTNEDLREETYLDVIPNDRWDIDDSDSANLEVFEYPESLDIIMPGVETVELTIVLGEIEGEGAQFLRQDIDEYGDEDGDVTSDEIDEFFSESFEELDLFRITIDDTRGETTYSTDTEGLEGLTDSTSPATIRFKYITVYDLKDASIHTVTFFNYDRDEEDDWDEEDDRDEENDQDEEDDEWFIEFEFSYSTSSNWIIDTNTVPEFLDPYISEDITSFTISPFDSNDIENNDKDFEFDIIEDERDEGEEKEKDIESTITLKEGDEETIEVGDEEFNVTVDEVDEEGGTVSLSIEGEEVELEVGASEDVDTDGDGEDDTKVTLEGIENGEAELKFTEITDVKESDGGSPGFEVMLLISSITIAIIAIRKKH